MKNLASAQYNDILQLIEEVLVSMEQDIQDMKNTEFEDLILMYQDDLSYGARCLEIFKDNRDPVRLMSNLHSQDTAPRERYYKVFEYVHAVRDKGEVFI